MREVEEGIVCWRMGGGGMRGIAGYAFEKGAYFVGGVVVLLLRLLRMLSVRIDDAVDVAAAGDDGAHDDGARVVVGVVVVIVIVVDAAAVVGAAREDAAERGSTMINGGSMTLPLAGVETE